MNVHYETIRGAPWDIEIVYAGIYVADVSINYFSRCCLSIMKGHG